MAKAGQIFAVFQTATVFIEAKHGLGKSIQDVNPPDLVSIQKVRAQWTGIVTKPRTDKTQGSYASDILFIITLWLTKCSAAFLFLRLTPNYYHVLASRAILAATTVWAVASILMVALRCNLVEPWIFINVQCTNLVRFSMN